MLGPVAYPGCWAKDPHLPNCLIVSNVQLRIQSLRILTALRKPTNNGRTYSFIASDSLLPTTSAMSRLEALPQHLLRDILRYLLLSDRVRGPPNRYLIEDYDFQVAILCTNKAINQEAAHIFYQDNKWIKFRNGYGDPMETALINHETPYFKLTTMKFENHVAQVDVNPNVISLPTYGGKTTTGLLLLQDIPKFARVLRIVDFANFFGYNIKFALHTPPGGVGNLSKEDQERLLLPMEQGESPTCICCTMRSN